MHNIRCPCCDKIFETDYSPDYREGATMNCPECNALLLNRNHHILDFHKWLHYENDGDWPLNGEDSHSINLSEKD